MKLMHIMGVASALLFSSAAFAADIPAFQPEQTQVSYDWSGLSVSIHGGLAAGDLDNPVALVDPMGATVLGGNLGQTFGGGLAGAGIGYNFQFGGFVLGVAADASWSEAEALTSIDIGAPVGASAEIVTEMNWLATARGVVGYAFDNVLVYATGGGAWADLDTTASGFGSSFSGGDTAQGWAVGGGIDVGVTQNISVGLEYLYVDLGETDALNIDIGGGASVQSDTDLDFHTVKAKAAYRF